jgi:hypothetical protein
MYEYYIIKHIDDSVVLTQKTTFHINENVSFLEEMQFCLILWL